MKIGPVEIKFKRRRASVREFGGVQSVGSLLLQLEALLGNSSTNLYVSRGAQAAETIRKYRGQAVKGNLLVKNIINTRSAFTVGRGLNYSGGGTAEQDFVKEFLRVNGIGLSYLQQLARERCFEGQCLLTLRPGAKHIPQVRFISWVDTSYDVITNPTDYGDVQGLSYRAGDRDAQLSPGEFAFFKFDTRLNSVEGTPLLGGVLNTIEDLDDALTSWRAINNKFANPTPYFKFEIESDAEEFQKRLADTNWSMGSPLAGAGDASMLQIGYGPYTSMMEEISAKAKIVSGHTGVPVHYFGFPDLMNNRSVADDVKEMFVSVSEIEQAEWSRGFTDLIGRAMAMFNSQTGSRLDFTSGVAAMEFVSEIAYKQLIDVWLPLYLDGAITLETFLAKVPGVDEKTEAPLVLAQIKARGGTPRQLSGASGQLPVGSNPQPEDGRVM
jgi:hypothetical protein